MTSLKHVYVIICQGDLFPYIKIGKTINLYTRLANLRTGCPLLISHVFVINSPYEEEVLGLEKLLHRLLPFRHRGEWYKGTEDFFKAFENLLNKINSNNFSHEEICDLPDMNAGTELEIMLHEHLFHFYQITLPIRKNSDFLKVAKKISISNIFLLIKQ